jgi:diguanylate cyclase (GGDEF)-like protein/PAS domain S-box-containing protein
MDLDQLRDLLLREAPTALAVIDVGGEFVYVSPSSYRILGHEESVVGRNVVEFLHPDDLEAAMVSMAGTVERTGPAEPITLRFARGDGSWEPLDIVAVAVNDESTDFMGLIITARAASGTSVDHGVRDRHAGLDDASVPCLVLDGRGTLVRANAAATAVLGDEVGRIDRVPGLSQFLVGLSSTETRGQLETNHDGTHIRWTGTVQRDRQGRPAFFVLTGTDVTAERRAQVALRQSETRLRTIVSNASDVILVVDGERNATFVAPSVRTLLGWDVDEIYGSDVAHRLVPVDDHAQLDDLLAAASDRPGTTTRGHLRMLTRAGEARHMDVSAVHLTEDEGAVDGTVLTAHDVTSRFEREAELERRSLYDHLTGLPNRVLLFDRLAVSLRRRHSRGSAILFVDLDGFKAVNDTFGHEVGDEVLIEVADRLLSVARQSDTVARLAGDEFVILVDDIESTEGAATIARRIVESIAAPFVTSRGVARIGASVGICLAHGDQDPEAAVRQADQAMYQAKRNGKGAYSFAGLTSSSG